MFVSLKFILRLNCESWAAKLFSGLLDHNTDSFKSLVSDSPPSSFPFLNPICCHKLDHVKWPFQDHYCVLPD